MTAGEAGSMLEALLADMPEPAAWRALADAMAAAHRAAPAAPGDAFLTAIATGAGDPPLSAEWSGQRPQLERRARSGRVRRIDGQDRDTLFALAATLARMTGAGHVIAANLVANRYADLSPQGATGWAAMPLFVAMHAPDRAEALLEPVRQRLVVIGGLSGTGKSTLAGLVAPRIGRAIGGRVLRSDVFRKRLAGIAPESRLPPAHYTRDNDADTYAALFEAADDHLACGSSVVLDAVFLRRSERDVVETLAARHRAAFTGIWLEAPERDRIARVTARTGDASDATADVVRLQSRHSVGEIHWHRIRANREQALVVAAARAAIERTRA